MSDMDAPENAVLRTLSMELTQDLIARGLITREQVEELKLRCSLTGDGSTPSGQGHFAPEPEVLAYTLTLTNIPFKPVADFRITQEAVALYRQGGPAPRSSPSPLTAEGLTLGSPGPSLAAATISAMIVNG